MVSSSNDATSKAKEDFKRKLQQKAEQENSNLWQHPFVDALKHFKLLPGSDFKLNKKAGDVNEYFVSKIQIFLTASLGQGNRQESHQHRGIDLSEQLHSVAAPFVQYQDPRLDRQIRLLPSKKPAPRTAFQLSHRPGDGGAISWDSYLYQ